MQEIESRRLHRSLLEVRGVQKTRREIFYEREINIMKTLITSTAAKTAFLFAFVLVLTSSSSAQSAAKKEEAIVGVAATRKVNSQQSGLWTVGVDSAKNTVRVANSAANPVAVELFGSGSARKPFQVRFVAAESAFGQVTLSGYVENVPTP
jgi:hypothetical protein